MGALEKVAELKKQNIPEDQIISQLKEEGISPGEINDALNQSKIKEAVADENQNQNTEMTPSIMDQDQIAMQPTNPNQNYQDNYYPQEQQYEQDQQFNNSYEPQTAPQQEYYEDQSYDPETYSDNYGSSDLMIEIAEQVFSEKIKKVEKTTKEISDFKTIYQSKIEDIDQRLKRIEKMFDKMQIAILEKVGDFGKNIQNLQKEINMVEDSFSKVVNPLTDKKDHKK